MERTITLAVDVDADADTAFTAITTQAGQAAFWTTDCDVSATEARFGFPEAPVDVRMRVDASDAQLVRWTCLGDFPGWEDSVIEWELGEPQGEQGTSVVLRHSGLHGPFAESDVALGNVAHTWAMILDRLQTYLRDGEPVPYFG